MGFSRETVRLRFREWDKAAAVVAPPTAPTAPTVQAVAPVPEPAAPPIIEQAPAASPVLVAPPVQSLWGLESMPQGLLHLVLVNSQANQQIARSYDQHAVGITAWHAEYRELDVFKNAEFVWVIVNRDEDNKTFLLSIAADVWIRERCLISGEGVHAVCKWLLQHQRGLQGRKWTLTDSQVFASVFHFTKIPKGNHLAELEAILKPQESPAQINWIESAPAWSLGGSGWGGTGMGIGRIVIATKEDDDAPNAIGGQGLLGT